MAIGDGRDYGLENWGGFQDINEIKNNFASAPASKPSAPVAGVLWWDATNDLLYLYDGSDWREFKGGGVPVGGLVCWVAGYFTDGVNGGYTRVLGSANSIAAANAFWNGDGFYVCDGAALNDSDSPIFNGAGRYLPNLTDDRFTMGNVNVGGIGGSNTMAHTHDVDIDNFTTGFENATVNVGTGVGITVSDHHTHDIDLPNTTTSAASNENNIPRYLTAFILMRVK